MGRLRVGRRRVVRRSRRRTPGTDRAGRGSVTVALPVASVPTATASPVVTLAPATSVPGLAGAPGPSGTPAPSRRLLPARRLGTPSPNATVVRRIDLGPTMARFALDPDEEPQPIRPGQYVAIGLERDGRIIQRPYSVASSAAEAWLDFAIRLVPGGALTPALWRLGPGDRVRIGPPRGLFGLSEGDPRTHLLLATGTGIAPLVAMARSLHASAAPPRTVIVHGVARVEELAYAAELGAWAGGHAGWRYVPAISRPTDPSNVAWRGPVGRLDVVVPAVLDDLRLDPSDAVAYVCGSPDMIHGLSRGLVALGMPASAVRSEAY
ncbi:MAG TPA: FAD-binding oxidoreductase [Candidatus Binatus sp.]|nr:FAD-binding oxidoreductase [Candidatus Binatus sp.]